MTRRRQTTRVGMAVTALAWIVAFSTTGAQAPAKSVNDGVYSSAQAGRGQALFQSMCTTCHATDRFTGEDFVSAWSGKPVVELFKAMQTMPEDNPGSLSPQQYGDVMAYFLQLNKFPSGSDELKGDVDTLAKIAMEAPKH